MKPWLWVCIAVLSRAAMADVSVAEFSSGSLEGWRQKVFKGETSYTLVEQQGQQVLKAGSHGTASGMYKRVRIDLRQTPYLHWRWKVENTLGKLDETQRAGDDYSARVYVVFSGGLLFWKTRALNYVWSSSQRPGAVWPNAFTGNAIMLAVEGGTEKTGQWQQETRNVREDFRQQFGYDVRYVDAVAIMSDTDNAGGTATAYYGDIYFSER